VSATWEGFMAFGQSQILKPGIGRYLPQANVSYIFYEDFFIAQSNKHIFFFRINSVPISTITDILKMNAVSSFQLS